MSPTEIAATLRLRLAGELREDLEALRLRAASVAELLVPTSDARGEHLRTLALAFEIERFYTGVETTLARTIRELDGSVPTGPSWYLELLRAAAVPIGQLRPALVTREAMPHLTELLRFRHLARHGYDVEPELGRLEPLAAHVAAAWSALERMFRAFADALAQAS